MHQRIVIRSAIKELLIAGNTVAGSRVFSGRLNPVTPAQTPAILVYATKESLDRDDITKAGRRLRTAEIVIKGIVKADADGEATFDDLLDNLAEQIETIMDANELLDAGEGKTAETVWFDSSEFFLSGEGEKLLGVVNLIYSISYRG
jgi:hypothetical protein